MAQLINVKLSRFDAQPWGFRLQGGKDFGAPLLIQKAGDAVIRINSTEVFNLRHKDAQDTIVRAGNNFEITLQRGGSTWKPAVAPIGAVPSINSAAPAGNIAPVTKTSLAARPQAAAPIASGHNVAAKPFGGAQVNGSLGDGTVKSIVNKQYNTPVGMYSEETIAETLSAQAEVLAGGVLGVNFKKNEKSYNPDTAPVPGSVTSPPVSGLRHVSAPETKSTPTTPHEDPFKILPPGQNICADCERLIVGVFVRIKDKNLHVECFKCATCGSSLKNVGYYNINNKLYCDIHAKMVARQHPPAPNLEPITIPPGGKAPAGAISAALAGAPGLRQGPAAAPAPRPVPAPAPAPAPAPMAPGSPQTLGPVPFHPTEHHHKNGENGFVFENNLKNIITAMPAMCIDEKKLKPNLATSDVTKEFQGQTPSGIAPPKPFSAPTAPTTSPARPAPEAIVKTLRESVEQEKYPICVSCSKTIRRGPFITALGKIWCPEHFVCVNGQCRRPLQDIGFVEEKGELYCEYCFEQFIAPPCDKCSKKIKGDCVNAIGKHFHPECFLCAYCGKLFGNSPFFLEDGLPYCEADWNELFTTKCFACGFPIEAGDRWVEALNNNYHSQCFNCTNCKKNLEGQSFYAKGGRPFCKAHALSKKQNKTKKLFQIIIHCYLKIILLSTINVNSLRYNISNIIYFKKSQKYKNYDAIFL
ncbi:LIM domain-containing protein jub [Gryllus bimaculatus]|nr:LIM domain-containing protein jub [Gryllus bimaculatus]